jgi:hypothetical protein
MAWAEVRFWCALLTCRSPESACDENTSANIAASQQVDRITALSRFIIFILFLRASAADSLVTFTELQLTLCNSASARRYCSRSWKKGKQNHCEKRPGRWKASRYAYGHSSPFTLVHFAIARARHLNALPPAAGTREFLSRVPA